MPRADTLQYMRRLLSSLITASMIFVMIALPVRSTQAELLQSGGRVVGGVEYQAAGISRLAQIAISQEPGSTASGLFHYSDEFGEWYRVEVREARIGEHQAFFAGEVVAASRAEWIGLWFSGAMIDAGELSAERDQISGAFATEAQARLAVSHKIAPSEMYRAERGNLLIYTP
jgi:hypothetical protein